MSRKDLVELALNDPIARAEIEADPLVQARRRLYDEAAAGLLAELVEAGFPRMHDVQQLRRLGDYRAAIPILLRWLVQVRYLLLAEEIVRILTVPAARENVFPVLLRLFEETPEPVDPMWPKDSPPMRDMLRTTIGIAMGDLLTPAFADDAIRLAADRSYGESRALIVAALPKTKDERVPSLLLELLDDPTVAPDAIKALGKLRVASARDRIVAMLDSNDKNVRDQAKKALKRIDPT